MREFFLPSLLGVWPGQASPPIISLSPTVWLPRNGMSIPFESDLLRGTFKLIDELLILFFRPRVKDVGNLFPNLAKTSFPDCGPRPFSNRPPYLEEVGPAYFLLRLSDPWWTSLFAPIFGKLFLRSKPEHFPIYPRYFMRSPPKV